MRIWKRLGAAAGAAALLAGGLVGVVAGPAHAGHADEDQSSLCDRNWVHYDYWSVDESLKGDDFREVQLEAESQIMASDVAQENAKVKCSPHNYRLAAHSLFHGNQEATGITYIAYIYAYEVKSLDSCRALDPPQGFDSNSGDCIDVLIDRPVSEGYCGTGADEESARDECVDNGLVDIECESIEYDNTEGFGCTGSLPEPVQVYPPPPPCWSAEALNNCPVGGALRFAAPQYAMVGVPVTMYAYASWRPDANSPAQPTNGTAVIRVDGEDYSGVEFVDGIAEWRFIPETEGMKEFTASGVLFSGLSGANAYIDTVEARTYVLEYDPAAYATALKKKAVEVGDTYVITDPNQARSYAEDRYEWSVSEKSEDVCAVYETKKGAVKAKFTDSGKCTVIWLDKESEESGKYTFIAKK